MSPDLAVLCVRNSTFGLPDTKEFPLGGMIGGEEDGAVTGSTCNRFHGEIVACIHWFWLHGSDVALCLQRNILASAARRVPGRSGTCVRVRRCLFAFFNVISKLKMFVLLSCRQLDGRGLNSAHAL